MILEFMSGSLLLHKALVNSDSGSAADRKLQACSSHDSFEEYEVDKLIEEDNGNADRRAPA